MSLLDGVFSRLGYTRLSNGTHSYSYRKRRASFNNSELMAMALENPVTYACIEIRAKVLAQVEFIQLDDKNEVIKDSEIQKLIANPNEFQSKEDLLKQMEWFKSVYGWVYQKPYGAEGMEKTSIFNLSPNFIKFDKKFLSPISWTDKDINNFLQQEFQYCEPSQEKRTLRYEDIIAFYDTGNALDYSDRQNNPLVSPSRMNSVIKPITNINMALEAENVMIQTNGREIFSGGSERGFNLGAALPMEEDDKENIESNLIRDYGMTSMKRRSIATNQLVNYQSLHIKLKDLGLHESISNNANLIREAFEVPNELYKSFQKGSTYENQKEALISFIQKTIQPIADDIASSYTQFFGLEGSKIIASFDHLPVMQHTEEKKAEKVLKIARAYQNLTSGGSMPKEEAIDILMELGVNFNNNGTKKEKK